LKIKITIIIYMTDFLGAFLRLKGVRSIDSGLK